LMIVSTSQVAGPIVQIIFVLLKCNGIRILLIAK
jgi:hypothetical protein